MRRGKMGGVGIRLPQHVGHATSSSSSNTNAKLFGMSCNGAFITLSHRCLCWLFTLCFVAGMVTQYTLSLLLIQQLDLRGKSSNNAFGVGSVAVRTKKSNSRKKIVRSSSMTATGSLKKKVMHPFDSHPPKAIDFLPLLQLPGDSKDTSGDAYKRIRHHCIARIRKRQEEILQPYLSSAAAVNRLYSSSSSSNSHEEFQKSPYVLVDPAYHSNVGDHMITLGELTFLSHTLQLNQTTNTAATATYLDQCTYIQGGDFVKQCSHYFSSLSRGSTMEPQQQQQQKFAFWHGGGNWGDLWRIAQTERMKSISELLSRNYTVLGFPQSYHYVQEKIELEDFFGMQKEVMRGLILLKHQKLRKDYDEQVEEELDEVEEELDEMSRKAKDDEEYTLAMTKNKKSFVEALQPDSALFQQARSRVIFTWREVSSYEKAKQMYPYFTNVLLPDIAFQLGPYEKMSNPSRSKATTSSTVEPPSQVDVLLFFRADHESVLTRERRNKEYLRGLFETYTSMESATFRVVDWPDRLDIFSPSSAEGDDDEDIEFAKTDVFFTDTSIQLLSLGKVVVCDRLHAAILCYLTGIPFVYIDQVSGKITKTLSVAMSWGKVEDDSARSFSPPPPPIGDSDRTEKHEQNQRHRRQQEEHSISVDCLDGNTSMWARAHNLTHALQLAEAFLTKLK